MSEIHVINVMNVALVAQWFSTSNRTNQKYSVLKKDRLKKQKIKEKLRTSAIENLYQSNRLLKIHYNLTGALGA